jgi:hypothetical protein
MLQSGSSAPAQRQARDKSRTQLQIVNPDPKYGKIRLIEPTSLGYIHLAATIEPRRLSFLPTGPRKSALLDELKHLAHELERLDTVEKVTIYDAIAQAPVRRLPYVRERADTLHLARFDVVVLIETSSPAAARELESAPAYQAFVGTLASQASDLHVIVAHNIKRIGDVDKTRQGTFLFNYFVADDRQVMLDLWDYLADWYRVETGLDNSTLLAPLEGTASDFVAVNHARWDKSAPSFFLEQLSKPSFWTYVGANLGANHVGAMPILYRLSDAPHRPARRAIPWVLAAGAAAGTIALGAGLLLRRQRSTKRSQLWWRGRRLLAMAK